MGGDNLVNLLTLGALPLILALMGYGYKRMERADKRSDEREADEKKQLADAQAFRTRYLLLREDLSKLRNRCLRRFQQALDRAEAERKPELVRGLQDAIEELEHLELPPLE